MLKKIIIGAALLTLVLIVVACAGPTPAPSSAAPVPPAAGPSAAQTPSSSQASTSSPALNPAPKPSGPIKGEWIEAQMNGDTVSIRQSELEKNWNVHFKVNMQGSTENFMAYLLDDEIYVRANVCPPCRSIGYSLDDDVLVCDRCATTFDAESGDGIAGACFKYPKALVQYEVNDGNLLMKKDDLLTAYQNTLKQGWP